MNINQIIGYAIGAIIIALLKLAHGELAKMRADKNSYYNKVLDFKTKEDARAEQILGQQNYETGKQIVVDAVYKAEQLGKQMVWDGVTKHSKVLEFIEGQTNLKDQDIFDIIESTVGYINSHK